MAFPVESQTFGSYQWLMRETAAALQAVGPESRAVAIDTENMGLDRAAWTHEQKGLVDSLVQRGVLSFYTPGPLPGERYGHEWSFLRPVGTLDTVATEYEIDLPADFAMLDGPITYEPGESVMYRPITIVGEHQIRLRLAQAEFSGRPEWGAIRPKALDPEQGTQWELLLWPIPDDEYTLTYRYRVNPQPLTDAVAASPSPTPDPSVAATGNMPYGGQPHYGTILASCIAMAVPERVGEYHERLAASVSHDRRVASPAHLGYNRDYSDTPTVHCRDLQQNLTTYNDITY